MSKLYFKYGAMNCGKTTSLLQIAHNYEEQGMKVLLLKPKIDTKAADKVQSRLGVERKVDFLIKQEDYILQLLKDIQADCILVDEVQFLKKEQIDELYVLSTKIPVLCFGLRTDFLNNGFEGSTRLLELAHSISEIKNICVCGKKSTCNIRKVDGKPTFTGNIIEIDNQTKITYEAVCTDCYFKAKQLVFHK